MEVETGVSVYVCVQVLRRQNSSREQVHREPCFAENISKCRKYLNIYSTTLLEGTHCQKAIQVG